MYIPCRMTPQQFSYWLQGAIEIGGLTDFTPYQMETIARRIVEMTRLDPFSYAVLVTNRHVRREEGCILRHQQEPAGEIPARDRSDVRGRSAIPPCGAPGRSRTADGGVTNFEFLVWLLGFLELGGSQPITRKMLFIIAIMPTS